MATQTLSGLKSKVIPGIAAGNVTLDFVDICSDWCNSSGDAFTAGTDYEVLVTSGQATVGAQTASGFDIYAIYSNTEVTIFPLRPPAVEHLD